MVRRRPYYVLRLPVLSLGHHRVVALCSGDTPPRPGLRRSGRRAFGEDGVQPLMRGLTVEI
jgi:hypothetical protein